MDDISRAMETGQEWCGVGSWCKGILLKERERLHLIFKGGIKLTTNQMDPEISFHSRKWQGYQVNKSYLNARKIYENITMHVLLVSEVE